MFKKNQLVKATTKIIKQISKRLWSVIKKQIIWLLRIFFVTRRKQNPVNAGFVLPTVAMISIVVVLLTAAILFRSFERSKNASNVRVNEVVIRAASPALDRAKAKIEELFKDPRLPRSTPSDLSLSKVINDSINQYTFGDETQLKLVNEFNGTTNIQDEETLLTAWKYPVDTDNNGKFDSFTIYGIYFRTPPTTSTRKRSPLEARTKPMDEGVTDSKCISNVATSADLVGSQGWYKVGSKLKRSIFVYTTTVPITDIKTPNLDNTKYETLTGNKGFAALEYQQDRERIPLSNNAVIYEDDLEIAPGAGLSLNGRVFTNGNLLTRKSGSSNIRFYLVSSPKSCYYTEENSKIVVAGNVIDSRVNETSGSNSNTSVIADLFNKSYTTNSNITQGKIDNDNKTVPQAVYGNTAAFNDEAYARRIERLVEATNSAYPDNADLPDEVQDEISRSLAADSSLDEKEVRDEKLKVYFRKRTRRVPFAEIPFEQNPSDEYGLKYKSVDYKTNSPLLRENKNALRPVDEWVFPFDPEDGTTATGYAEIGVYNGSTANKIYLTATDPAEQVKAGKENKIGDRVLVGNNMPQLWYDSTKGIFVSSPEQGQTISGKQWDFQQNGTTNSTVTRLRYSQAYQLDNLGITNRDGFWEKAAAQKPTSTLDVVGGLRVITGAGIYLPDNRTSTSTSAEFTADLDPKADPPGTDKIWADSMAMGVKDTNGGLPYTATPYLKMRATVVYHYQDSSYDPKNPSTYQTPIACVASYYDPTNKTTAKNRTTDFGGNDLKDLTGVLTVDPDKPANTSNQSLNGIVYSASSLSTTNYTAALSYQASLKYPNGRPVNEPLQKALEALADNKNLTLSQQSAIDSAVCALKILDGTIGAPTNDKVPHGAIREIAFLDARQIKAIDKVEGSKQYDLDIELRQPLEIRATVLNLELLGDQPKNSGEFLFPNSGIIYATRDDALADESDTSADVSATDFKLDSTRRPNGIMLIKGSDLSRNTEYKAEEKGLILASNLPVYIKGDFNKHDQEEFVSSDKLVQPSWSNFYKRTNLNPNFACRPGQFSSCTSGEKWRPASVIADAITVLSSNFQEGYRQDGDYNLNDNYGNYALGYDLNGNNTLDTTAVTLNEKVIKLDLDGDGATTTTSVSTIDETKFGVDLNNDGDIEDTAVTITEKNIPGTVAARLNGFWDNNFVTSRNFTDSDYSSLLDLDTTKNRSSYFNNFVTPIQRRGTYSQYVMEICPKRVVTACKPDDWVVGYDLNGNGSFGDTNTYNGNSYTENRIKGNQLLNALADYQTDLTAFNTANPAATFPTAKFFTNNDAFNVSRLWSGTTATSAASDSNDSLTPLYPRRVAFLRYGNGLTVKRSDNTALGSITAPVDNKLVLDTDLTPIPLGISTSGNISYYPFNKSFVINGVTYQAFDSSAASPTPKRPRTQDNALLFMGTGSRTSISLSSYNEKYRLPVENTLTVNMAAQQPLLAPILQIQYPSPLKATLTAQEKDGTSLNWMQRAVETETNLVFAQGNTPERPTESNGGLENFVRYLETWDLGSTTLNHNASGSFIQFKRSSYATAPWMALLTTGQGGIFNYPQKYTAATANSGLSPFYAPPSRRWGYDVALLTQLPDLFSQRFTSPSVNAPNEFYREVGRDDNWVKTLLCAAQKDTNGYGDATKYGSGYKYAVSSDLRGTCP